MTVIHSYFFLFFFYTKGRNETGLRKWYYSSSSPQFVLQQICVDNSPDQFIQAVIERNCKQTARVALMEMLLLKCLLNCIHLQ